MAQIDDDFMFYFSLLIYVFMCCLTYTCDICDMKLEMLETELRQPATKIQIDWKDAYEALIDTNKFNAFESHELLMQTGTPWFHQIYRQYFWSHRVIDQIIQDASGKNYATEQLTHLFTNIDPVIDSVLRDRDKAHEMIKNAISGNPGLPVQLLPMVDTMKIYIVDQWFSMQYNYKSWSTDYVFRPYTQHWFQNHYIDVLLRNCTTLKHTKGRPSLAFIIETCPGLWAVCAKGRMYDVVTLEHAMQVWLSYMILELGEIYTFDGSSVISPKIIYLDNWNTICKFAKATPQQQQQAPVDEEPIPMNNRVFTEISPDLFTNILNDMNL